MSSKAFLKVSISVVCLSEEMTGFDMDPYFRVLKEKLEPLDVETLKFILADSCRSRFHCIFSLLVLQQLLSFMILHQYAREVDQS